MSYKPVKGLQSEIFVPVTPPPVWATVTKELKDMRIALATAAGVHLKTDTRFNFAGDERVIVRELLGVELKPGQLPLEAKAVVSNVETLKNVTYAIENRKPVITKDITVGGQVADVSTGKVFFDVPIGMPIKHYIDACGGYNVCHGEIVMGGPFTGKSADEDSPVTKTTGGVLVAMPFIHDTRKAGIIACECGAQEDRLKEIATAMGATVVAKEKCKRMIEVGGRYRCDLPGICPGQAETVLKLKKEGAEIIITGTCED